MKFRNIIIYLDLYLMYRFHCNLTKSYFSKQWTGLRRVKRLEIRVYCRGLTFDNSKLRKCAVGVLVSRDSKNCMCASICFDSRIFTGHLDNSQRQLIITDTRQNTLPLDSTDICFSLFVNTSYRRNIISHFSKETVVKVYLLRYL